MTEEFAIKKVALDVLAHLELHREQAVQDEPATRLAVEAALEPVRRSYVDSQLPAAYLQALDHELGTTIATAWRAVAVPFTELEKLMVPAGAAGNGLNKLDINRLIEAYKEEAPPPAPPAP